MGGRWTAANPLQARTAEVRRRRRGGTTPRPRRRWCPPPLIPTAFCVRRRRPRAPVPFRAGSPASARAATAATARAGRRSPRCATRWTPRPSCSPSGRDARGCPRSTRPPHPRPGCAPTSPPCRAWPIPQGAPGDPDCGPGVRELPPSTAESRAARIARGLIAYRKPGTQGGLRGLPLGRGHRPGVHRLLRRGHPAPGDSPGRRRRRPRRPGSCACPARTAPHRPPAAPPPVPFPAARARGAARSAAAAGVPGRRPARGRARRRPRRRLRPVAGGRCEAAPGRRAHSHPGRGPRGRDPAAAAGSAAAARGRAVPALDRGRLSRPRQQRADRVGGDAGAAAGPRRGGALAVAGGQLPGRSQHRQPVAHVRRHRDGHHRRGRGAAGRALEPAQVPVRPAGQPHAAAPDAGHPRLVPRHARRRSRRPATAGHRPQPVLARGRQRSPEPAELQSARSLHHLPAGAGRHHQPRRRRPGAPELRGEDGLVLDGLHPGPGPGGDRGQPGHRQRRLLPGAEPALVPGAQRLHRGGHRHRQGQRPRLPEHAGVALPGHGRWASPRPFMAFKHSERELHHPPPNDLRFPIHARLWANCVSHVPAT